MLNSKFAAIVVFCAALSSFWPFDGLAWAATSTQQQRAPILIPGIREPPEMQVKPVPLVIPTAPEKMLAKETKNYNGFTIPALTAVLAKFPDYSDGYAMRAGLLCEHGGERSAILSDINDALKYESNLRVKKSMAGLLSMRAKLEYAGGDQAAALADVWRAIKSNITKADNFANSSAVKPEKSASICTWTELDLDALVKQFPTDYRPFLLRGLYFSFFTTFSTDQSLLDQAIANFHKAVDVDPQTALPHYFIASVLLRWSFFKKFELSSEQHAAVDRTILDELNKSIALDPKLSPALLDRANFYGDHKQTQQAISDYERFNKLRPQNADALDGLGHAEMEVGNPYGAISDFGRAIDALRASDNSSGLSIEYATRAKAYMKTHQWHLAIKDLTSAISLNIGRQIMLINVGQFRALYPEYRAASNEAIAQKLNRTFFPNIKYDVFAKMFLQTNHGWPLDTSYYPERSRAYLNAGDWDRAAADFRRANAGASFATNSRWGEIASSQNMQFYIDLQTYDASHRNSIRIWIKGVPHGVAASGSSGSYSLQLYEVDCESDHLRGLAFTDYDASGSPIASREGGSWQMVMPDTIGEILFNGACRRE